MNQSSAYVTYQWVRQLLLLQHLPISSLKKLAAENPCQRLAAGRVIFRRGQQDDDIVYLFKGKVSLTDPDHSEQISAGSTAARVPLDNHQPRRCTVMAETDVLLFKLNHNLIDVITSDERSDQGISVDEIRSNDERTENQLVYRLYQDYMGGELKLASLPELALRVRKAVQDTGKTAHDIAMLIQADPAITGQIINIANSPLYRTDTRILDCQTAVARIGLENTRNIVTSLSIRQLFKPKSKRLTAEMSRLWRHSTQVAAIASVIASMVPSMKEDRALLAGLVHDIGILVILTYAEQFPQFMSKKGILEEAIDKLRGQMGALVLRYWSLPSDLVTVALEAENWLRDSDHGPDLCDVVQVAQLYSFIGTAEQSGKPGLFELPAFNKLPLCRQGPEKGLAILAEAKEQIRDMKQLLI